MNNQTLRWIRFSLLVYNLKSLDPHDPSFKDLVIRALDDSQISSFQLSHCFVHIGDLVCMGLIYKVNDRHESTRLRFAVEEEVTNWAENSAQALKY